MILLQYSDIFYTIGVIILAKAKYIDIYMHGTYLSPTETECHKVFEVEFRDCSGSSASLDSSVPISCDRMVLIIGTIGCPG